MKCDNSVILLFQIDAASKFSVQISFLIFHFFFYFFQIVMLFIQLLLFFFGYSSNIICGLIFVYGHKTLAKEKFQAFTHIFFD